MYLCTIAITAYLLAAGAVMLWAYLQKTDTSYTTKSGEVIDLSAHTELDPAINDFFAAVEEKNLEEIYRYAAPELKEKISYELFSRDLWPNSSVEDIKVLFTHSSSRKGNEIEHILIILMFKENGMSRYGSMRWEKNSDSLHYDTIPFKITLLSEFGPFPSHVIN